MDAPDPGRAVRVLTIASSAAFLCAGFVKLASFAPLVESFHRWGYPDVLRLLVGAVEITGALALLVPRLASVGAILLGTVMVGAIYTHLFRGLPILAFLPLATLALLMYIGNRWLDRAPDTTIRPTGYPPARQR